MKNYDKTIKNLESLVSNDFEKNKSDTTKDIVIALINLTNKTIIIN